MGQLYGAQAALAWVRRHRVAVIIAIFALAVLPVLPTSHTYHGDEHFYTDSAISMLRTGDYLTPVYSDGSLRFNKPIFTYWVVAVAFKVLGISFWSARLGCLVAGCLTLWLAYRLGLELFRDRSAAWLGMLILASCLLLYEGAARINPDIFLTLFITMSLLGFVRLISGGPDRTRAAIMAYVGAGLALETKGLLGVLCVVYSALFCLSLPDRWSRLRRLFHLPAILAGVVVGTAWFAWEYLSHGDVALRDFIGDQVTARLVANNRSHFATNFIGYAGGILVSLFPWWLFVGEGLRAGRVRAGLKDHRLSVRFVIGWGLCLMLVMSVGNVVRGRYLTPLYPFFSCLLGYGLSELHRGLNSGRLLRSSRIVLRLAGVTLGIVGSIFLLLGFRIHSGLILAGMIILGGAALAWISARRPGMSWQMVAVFLLSVTLYMTTGAILRPLLGCTPTYTVTDRISGMDPPPDSVLTIGMQVKYASQIRVLLQDAVPVRRAQDASSLPRALSDVLVFPSTLTQSLDLAGYSIETSGYEYAVLTFDDVHRVLSAPDWSEALAGYRIPYCIAIRSKAIAHEQPARSVGHDLLVRGREGKRPGVGSGVEDTE